MIDQSASLQINHRRNPLNGFMLPPLGGDKLAILIYRRVRSHETHDLTRAYK